MTKWKVHLNVSPAVKTYYHREIEVSGKNEKQARLIAMKEIARKFDFTEVEEVVITNVEQL